MVLFEINEVYIFQNFIFRCFLCVGGEKAREISLVFSLLSQETLVFPVLLMIFISPIS